MQMTHDGLTAFRRIGGREGAQVVANLATTVPRPTDGGTTYSFMLRRGIRYSNGATVRAADVRSSLERAFELRSDWIYFLDGLVGARRCMTSRRCDLSDGVVVDDASRTVTIRLTRPDPELPAKLAFPVAAVVSSETPRRDTGRRPLPATGPYMVASFAPRRQVRLVRNPHFRAWSPARPDGYPDEIVIRLDIPEKARVGAVARGDADATTLPRAVAGGGTDLAGLRARYGSRLRSNPGLAAAYVALNVEAPPFDDVRVRRAVNLALDRGAVVRAAGGVEWVVPTCQVLPPNFPGYRTYCAYERDLGQARRLVAESGTKGASVAVVTRTFGIETTSPLVDALRVLGYDARLEVVDDDDIRSRFEARDYQALWTAWVSDYPSAATWIEPQYSCRGVAEGANFSGLCDRAIDREIARAKRLQADDPSTANDVWGRVDRMVMDHAAIVPLFVGQLPYFVSERVGNYQYNPVFELLLDQLWVR
jgi:peptide/nickel transport system substrate-binding protein